MQRWFLSYNSIDLPVVERLEGILRLQVKDTEIFFAPKKLRAGGYWLPKLAEAIDDANAFILFVGENGLGPWQVIEYYEALDKRVKQPDFPIVLVLMEGSQAPGLPFLRQLHWIVTPDPASADTVGKLADAAAGGGARPGELWRYTAPYRGLAAMTEADSDFFFGREQETVDVLAAVGAAHDRLAVLLGNSGVGKSSLAQAGVLGALKRQAFPEGVDRSLQWPPAFHESRRWCFLKMQPGNEPVKALVEPFLKTWQFDPTDPKWEERRTDWIAALAAGKATLSGLLDATERRYEELGQPKPPAFFLYVDQGEELYARSEESQRASFSKLIADAISDPRLFCLMSLRSDFFGALQNDQPLFAIHRQINVPPLREAALADIVSRPAAMLSARFESAPLATDLARRAAEESARDAGALPLLSYLLDDMWTDMVRRGDGVLRLPPQAVELGGVLAERADAFLARNPQAEGLLRRLLTLKLATVREDGEPTRRRAPRSEFSDEEWRMVSDLADHPNRLLIAATPEAGETYAEVAHEAIFKRWGKLREWIAAERDFLAWRSSLEGARRAWEAAPRDACETPCSWAWLSARRSNGWRGGPRIFPSPIATSSRRASSASSTSARNASASAPSANGCAGACCRSRWSRWFWSPASPASPSCSCSRPTISATPPSSSASSPSSANRRPRRRPPRPRPLPPRRRIRRRAPRRASTPPRSPSTSSSSTLPTACATLPACASARSAPSSIPCARPSTTWPRRRPTILNCSAAAWRCSTRSSTPISSPATSTTRSMPPPQSLKISRKLFANDPESAFAERDVSISLERLGDARIQAGDSAGALTAYKERLEFARRLLARQPGNLDVKRDVSVALNKIGDVELRDGNTKAALAAYEEGLVIARELAETATDKAQAERDVSISLTKVGDMKMQTEEYDAALKVYEESMDIRRRLATEDPGSSRVLSDLSVGLARIGDVKARQNDPEAALAAYQEGLDIARRLALMDSENTQVQRNVSVSLNRIGELKLKANDRDGAFAAYQEGLDIARHLAETNPASAEAQTDLVYSLTLVAGLSDNGKPLYEESLDILNALNAQGRLTSDEQGWIGWVNGKIADLDAAAQTAKTR